MESQDQCNLRDFHPLRRASQFSFHSF
jgi:hypothetical protein